VTNGKVAASGAWSRYTRVLINALSVASVVNVE